MPDSNITTSLIPPGVELVHEHNKLLVERLQNVEEWGNAEAIARVKSFQRRAALAMDRRNKMSKVISRETAYEIIMELQLLVEEL